MSNRQTGAPSPVALLPPVAVNLNQVPGCQAQRAVTGLFYCYAALVFTVNCRIRRHSATYSLSPSTRPGSASTTTPNAMPPTKSRRCCQVMPALMSIAETTVSSVAILFFNMDTLLFRLLAEQQGGRWNGSRYYPWPGLGENSGQDSRGSPTSTFLYQSYRSLT